MQPRSQEVTGQPRIPDHRGLMSFKENKNNEKPNINNKLFHNRASEKLHIRILTIKFEIVLKCSDDIDFLAEYIDDKVNCRDPIEKTVFGSDS